MDHPIRFLLKINMAVGKKDSSPVEYPVEAAQVKTENEVGLKEVPDIADEDIRHCYEKEGGMPSIRKDISPGRQRAHRHAFCQIVGHGDQSIGLVTRKVEVSSGCSFECSLSPPGRFRRGWSS